MYGTARTPLNPKDRLIADASRSPVPLPSESTSPTDLFPVSPPLPFAQKKATPFTATAIGSRKSKLPSLFQSATSTTEKFWHSISEQIRRNPHDTLYIESVGNFNKDELAILAGLNPKIPPNKINSTLTVLKSEGLFEEASRGVEIHPLLKATIGDNLELFKELLSSPDTEINDASPLMWAVLLNRKEIASHLLEKGAFVPNKLIEIALADKNYSLAEVLVGSIRDINEDLPSEEPLLIHFTELDDLDAVKFLIQHGASIEAASTNFPLVAIALENENFELATLLIQHGADVNAPLRGEYIINYLISKGCQNSIRFLISINADLNIVDKNGLYPLLAASSCLQFAILDLLLTHGADPLRHTPSLLSNAADSGNILTLEALVKSKKPIGTIEELSYTFITRLLSRSESHCNVFEFLKSQHLFSQSDVERFEKIKFTLNLSALFDVVGHTQIGSKSYSWNEGSYLESLAHDLLGVLPHVEALFPEVYNFPLFRYVLESAAESAKLTDIGHLKRYKQALPVFINGGSEDHSVDVGLLDHPSGALAVYIDRGTAGSHKFYEIDRDEVDLQFIQRILLSRFDPHENMSGTFAEYLPQKLYAQESQRTQLFSYLCNLPQQTRGNCTWATLEGVFVAASLFDLLNQRAFEIEKYSEDEVEQIRTHFRLSFCHLSHILKTKYLEQASHNILEPQIFDAAIKAHDLDQEEIIPAVLQHFQRLKQQLSSQTPSLAARAGQ